MRATAVVSAMDPSNVISPQRPHMQSDLTREESSTRAEIKITRRRDGSSEVFHVEPARQRPRGFFAFVSVVVCVPVSDRTAATTSTRPVPLSNDVVYPPTLW